MNTEKLARNILPMSVLIVFVVLPAIGIVTAYFDGSLDQRIREAAMGDVEYEEYRRNDPRGK